MRVLSIQQPWAWLIVNGYKDIENRDWPTKVRGEIAIHAGKRIDEGGIRYVRKNFSEIALPTEFQTGGIVGTAEVDGCVEHHASPWFMGRFGFLLSRQKPCAFIPLRGQLGFFAADITPSAHPRGLPNG